MGRIRAKAALVGALAIALIALTAGPALAAVPQPPYDNTNPATTGCSTGAVILASYPITSTSTGAVVGTMEVRYSAACDSNWVRTNNTLAGTTSNKYIDRISTYNPGPPQTGWTFNSQFDADYGLGWSYSLQLGGASGSCNHVSAWFTDSNNVIVATSGGQRVIC